jgi:hypothetical protein
MLLEHQRLGLWSTLDLQISHNSAYFECHVNWNLSEDIYIVAWLSH